MSPLSRLCAVLVALAPALLLTGCNSTPQTASRIDLPGSQIVPLSAAQSPVSIALRLDRAPDSQAEFRELFQRAEKYLIEQRLLPADTQFVSPYQSARTVVYVQFVNGQPIGVAQAVARTDSSNQVALGTANEMIVGQRQIGQPRPNFHVNTNQPEARYHGGTSPRTFVEDLDGRVYPLSPPMPPENIDPARYAQVPPPPPPAPPPPPPNPPTPPPASVPVPLPPEPVRG